MSHRSDVHMSAAKSRRTHPARLLALGALAMLSVPPAHAGDRLVGAPFATRSPVIAQHGMVCTSQPLAAQIGLDILKAGGSAVDAAIATNAALGLMEPTGSGVGGDLFVILWDNERRELVGLNGSGRSPRGLSLEGLKQRLGEGDSIPLKSGLSVSVPGCVDGWFAMHERYGKLPMSEVLAPAIRYAREGFPLSQVIAYYWGSARRYPDEPAFAAFRDTYMPGGQVPREGEVFRNPGLAATYAAIAEGGRDAFYTGPIAQGIVDAVALAGGALALSDLAEHSSEWVDPVSATYRGHEVWELPPNGQGIAALQILSTLEGQNEREDQPLQWHRMIEAKKLAYEDRAKFYTDPDFEPAPVGRLVSAEYGKQRLALIDDDKAAQSLPAGDLPLEHGDTVYLTVADSDGNVVSWIQSNYTGFGSGVSPKGGGFTLQNRGNLFALDPGHANVYAPGKRPFHTIIPAMMTKDGKPVLSFGVMGGAMQPQGHVQIVSNMLDMGMNVQEAGDAPRWRHEGSSQPTGEVMTNGGRVLLESGVPDAVRAGLEARGHEVMVRAGGYGGYQAIWIDDIASPDRVYRGASESRKDGAAIGW